MYMLGMILFYLLHIVLGVAVYLESMEGWRSELFCNLEVAFIKINKN